MVSSLDNQHDNQLSINGTDAQLTNDRDFYLHNPTSDKLNLERSKEEYRITYKKPINEFSISMQSKCKMSRMKHVQCLHVIKLI